MTEGKTFGEYMKLELQVSIWKREVFWFWGRDSCLLLRAKCGLPVLFQRSPSSHYHPCEMCSWSINSFSHVWQMGSQLQLVAVGIRVAAFTAWPNVANIHSTVSLAKRCCHLYRPCITLWLWFFFFFNGKQKNGYTKAILVLFCVCSF